MTVRTAVYDIDPPTLWPGSIPAGGPIEIDTREVAVVAIREIVQARLSAAHVSGLLRDLLAQPKPGENHPPALRWRGKGVGVGLEMQRAFSGIFGRFFARWYLERHHGFRFFAPIDGSPTRISSRLVVSRTGDIYLPDWVCAKPGSLCLAESKGSSAKAKSTASTASPLKKANEQLTFARVFVKNQTSLMYEQREVKGWAVMSRWATEHNALEPLLYVADPKTEGRPLTDTDTDDIVSDIARAHYRALFEGLGMPDIADRILPVPEFDVLFQQMFGVVEDAAQETMQRTSVIDPQTVRIADERFGDRPFLGAVVDAQGQLVPENVSSIVQARNSIPSGLRDALFFIGVDQKVLEAVILGKKSEPLHRFLGDHSRRQTRIPLVSYLDDGFVFVPISDVGDARAIESDILD